MTPGQPIALKLAQPRIAPRNTERGIEQTGFTAISPREPSLDRLVCLAQGDQRTLPRFFAHNSLQINLIGGTLLVGIGLFDLWVNRELIVSFLFSRGAAG